MAGPRAAGGGALNPLTGRRLTGETTGVQVVDPRVVVNPAQARQLLAAVTYVHSRGRDRDPNRGARLRAFFACLYYGGLRPGEAQNLDEEGSRHHARPLKRRRPEEVRPVPIPPALVEILREHLETFPTAPDGRLFFGAESAQNVPGSVYTRIWEQTRVLLTVYAKCIDGQAETYNDRISDLLGH